MVQSIPASKIVNIIPNVIAAGGAAMVLSGLILTDSVRSPIGSVLEFNSAAAVTAYFGSGSAEDTIATSYFAGPNGASIRPAQLFITQYNQADVAGWARGGVVDLATVKGITSGTLTVTVNGTAKTSSALNLSGATSLSNAAALIQAAFTIPGFTVAYDSILGGFVITSATTGAASTIAVTDGTNAGLLKLNSAGGLVTSAGAVAAVPAAFMDAVVAQNQAWFGFTTSFNASVAQGTAFAAWTNGQNKRYWYVCWTTDANNLTANPSNTTMAAIKAASYGGTTVFYAPNNTYKVAALALSWAASLNFAATDGRTTLAFRSQDGLVADVNSAANFDLLQANDVNFYGAYGTANSLSNYIYPGSISGSFLWADSYANQVWLNDSLQSSLQSLLTAMNSIPYNPDGFGLVRTAMAGPITDALNFGAVRAGVVLGTNQIAQINDAAGNTDAANSVSSDGYYLSVTDPGATARTQRKTPNIRFFYADGQSVQQINFNSNEVQ